MHVFYLSGNIEPGRFFSYGKYHLATKVAVRFICVFPPGTGKGMGKQDEGGDKLGHAEAFNTLQYADIHLAPDHDISLFDMHERLLRAPGKHFPGLKKRGKKNLPRKRGAEAPKPTTVPPGVSC